MRWTLHNVEELDITEERHNAKVVHNRLRLRAFARTLISTSMLYAVVSYGRADRRLPRKRPVRQPQYIASDELAAATRGPQLRATTAIEGLHDGNDQRQGNDKGASKA